MTVFAEHTVEWLFASLDRLTQHNPRMRLTRKLIVDELESRGFSVRNRNVVQFAERYVRKWAKNSCCAFV